MDAKKFLEKVEKELGTDFYTGVPDSLLKPLSDTIYMKYGFSKRHKVAANEGGAVGLAAGHYLAAGKPALVYMQNSGIGNAVNPIVSLLDDRVYGIPCVFVVGWRGEPGVHDEPQHVFQGEITTTLLEDMGLATMVIGKNTGENETDEFFKTAREQLKQGKSVAFVVRKGGFTTDASHKFRVDAPMTREKAIGCILDEAGEDIFVSTTGKTSREVFETREARGEGHGNDFLTVGSMGHASMIALGIALEKENVRVWCIDGDGAAMMHLGSMRALARGGTSNVIHVIVNNGSHESVGGMPIAGGAADFAAIGRAVGYKNVFTAGTEGELRAAVKEARAAAGPVLIEVRAALGARDNLGRPTTTPKENRDALMRTLKER